MTKPEKPLLPNQLTTLREAAAKPSVTLPVAVVPATGLYPYEFVHLRPNWIEFATDNTALDHHTITIPDKAPCRRLKCKSATAEPNSLLRTDFIQRNQPCEYCRNRGNEDCFISDDRDDSNRTITVADDHAAKQLQWWFSQAESVPWRYTHASRLRRAAAHTIDRPLNLTGLRNTFAARAAAMGLSQDIMLDYMGIKGDYPTSHLYRIIVEYSVTGPYPDGILKQRTYHSYLSLLESKGPLAASEMADHFDVTKGTVRELMKKYKSWGLIERTQEWVNGVQPALWTNTVEPGTPVRCEHQDCDEEFITLKRATHHERKSHTSG